VLLLIAANYAHTSMPLRWLPASTDGCQPLRWLPASQMAASLDRLLIFDCPTPTSPSPHRYEGIYLGIGNIFNPTQKPAASGAKIGQVNSVLGWSSDGHRWKWLVPNDSLIPLGEAGDFDACGIFGAKQVRHPLTLHVLSLVLSFSLQTFSYPLQYD
jgi:hypothetical protein